MSGKMFKNYLDEDNIEDKSISVGQFTWREEEVN